MTTPRNAIRHAIVSAVEGGARTAPTILAELQDDPSLAHLGASHVCHALRSAARGGGDREGYSYALP